jgi:RecJ-like exonuclease
MSETTTVCCPDCEGGGRTAGEHGSPCELCGGSGDLTFHIIPGASAVVTQEGLLAAAHAYEKAHRDAVDTDDYEAGLLAGARAFVEAAGIGVVKEVVIAEGRYIPSMRLVDRTPLLIKRKED